ncbi:hypothetical protein H8E77_15865 [bacterium]|nr:hypothetical protein [bacterium]
MTLTNSELDILEVFRKAKEVKKALNVSRFTGFTPDYVRVMLNVLVDNSYLERISVNRFKLTPKGKEIVDRKRPKDKSPASDKGRGPWNWRAMGLHRI